MLETKDIVPAIGTEGIDMQRRAQREAHLITRHAGLDLLDHAPIEIVALRDVDPVGRKQAAAARAMNGLGGRPGRVFGTAEKACACRKTRQDDSAGKYPQSAGQG